MLGCVGQWGNTNKEREMGKEEAERDYLFKVDCKGEEDKVEFVADVFITITPEIYQELLAYVAHYDTEVSGCGMVEQIVNEDKSIEYRVTEVYLPQVQYNSAAYTEIRDTQVHKLMGELLAIGKDLNQMKLHWHSHNDFGVFHSGTDDENYRDLLQKDYVVSLVLNKKSDVLGRVDILAPFRVTVSGVDVFVRMPMPKESEAIKRVHANIKALDKNIERIEKEAEEERKKKHKGFEGSTRHGRYEKGIWVPNKLMASGKDKTAYGDAEDYYAAYGIPNHSSESSFNDIAKESDELDRELAMAEHGFDMGEIGEFQACDYSSSGTHTCTDSDRCVQFHAVKDNLVWNWDKKQYQAARKRKERK